jgi:hypothetical protein
VTGAAILNARCASVQLILEQAGDPGLSATAAKIRAG